MCLRLPNELQAAWQEQIHDAVTEADAVLSNQKITQCHYQLSLTLRQALGADAGANFHTWAVWGSHKAGATIRGEDLAAAGPGTVLLMALGGVMAVAVGLWVPGAVAAFALVGMVVGALTWRAVLASARRRVPELILEGNRIVLDDIGNETARYLACLGGSAEREAARVRRFLASLRPGPTAADGQDLLRAAFRWYHMARCTADVCKKRHAACLANCLAILHEHIRLQPYIAASIPRPLRRLVTRFLLGFRVGPLHLRVSKDLATPAAEPLRNVLRSLGLSEATEVFGAVEVAGEAAQDWTSLRQRMRYVLGLFHRLHASPEVFASPFGGW